MQEQVEIQGNPMNAKHPGIPHAGGGATPEDERELLLRHRGGDPEAFARLVASYRRPVYSYLVRCGVPESDRDDLFQEIFVKIHASAGQYRSDRPLHPWLFTIVANTARTYHRKNKVREMVFADPPACEPRAAGADAERQAMAGQTAAWLEREIAKLPLAQREVLILTCIENLPQKEVAEILGLPVNTVKTHLRRARLALVSRFAQRNGIRNGEVPS
jgi:RNA polymerase sigma-70 factor (ECF subfamily)